MRKMCALVATAICAICANAASTTDLREIAVANTHFAGGALASVDVSLAPIYCATGTLYAAFADADMGDDLADWPNVLVAAQTVTESDTLINYAIPASWGSAGYKILRFFLVSSILRDGDYAARLEYVDFSASSGINTGVKTTEKSRVESRFMRITDDGQMSLYGSGVQTLTAWMGSNSGLTWRFNTKGVMPNVQTKNLWHDFVHSTNGVVTIRDGYAPVTNLYQAVSSFTSSANLYVFANGTDSSWTKTVRFAYLRHYTNDVLATSLVPCKLSDNTVAIFNTVSGAVVSSSGLTGGSEMVFASAFTNATATTVEYEERGASELDPSIAVDTSNQRTIGFSGRLSTIGAEPTFILLQYGGATKAMAEVEVDGTWSLVWDASGDIEWTSSAIEYTVVCSNECGQSVFVSGTSGSFNLVNNSSFTWTGLGATNTWSDAGNWSCASSGDHPGCPLIGGDAIFPDNTTAEIILDVDVSIDNYAVGTTGANIKLIAEDEHALTANSYFITNMTDTTVHASTYVFSGPIALTNLMTVGMGSKVRLENGVQAYSQKGLKLCNNEIAGLSYDSVFEVFSGSEAIFGNGLNSSESMMNGNTKIVINNATLVIGFLILNINVPGGTVLLEGTNPEFRVFLRIRSQTGTTTGTGKIVFSVPEGGYAREPFRFTNTSPGNFGGFAPIFFEIAPDSPAMAANRCTTPLIFSRDTSSINTTLIDIVQPKGVTEWTVDLDDDGTPTKTVTVGWKVKRGLAIFVR